jgi:hypothetical protein
LADIFKPNCFSSSADEHVLADEDALLILQFGIACALQLRNNLSDFSVLHLGTHARQTWVVVFGCNPGGSLYFLILDAPPSIYNDTDVSNF